MSLVYGLTVQLTPLRTHTPTPRRHGRGYHYLLGPACGLYLLSLSPATLYAYGALYCTINFEGENTRSLIANVAQLRI